MKNARRFVAVAGLLTAASLAYAQTLQDYENYMDALASAPAGTNVNNPGVGDLAYALQHLDLSLKTKLTQYCRTKQRDAASAGDFDKVDAYQAFQSCITSGDCTQTSNIQNQRTPQAAPPPPPPPAPGPTPTNTSGGGPSPAPTNTSGPGPAPTATGGMEP